LLREKSSLVREQGRAAARLVASGDCRFGIILCGTGQGIMMAANKVAGIRCGVCSDTFSARMIRQAMTPTCWPSARVAIIEEPD